MVDNGAGSVNVPVLLGGPSGLASGSVVTVPYTTNDGSAKAGTDYTSTSGTLTFNPGQTAKNIPIPIIDRSGSAPARDFSVTLGTPTNATIADGTGVVTIGASGATAVSSPGVSAPPDLVVGEADGYVDLPVTLNAPGETSVTVNYSSAAGTAGAGGTPCSFNQLFQQQSGTLTFTPGVTTQDVRIVLDNCGISEANGFASFYLNLSGNSSNSTLTRSSTQVDITGDNATGATPALYVRDAVVDNGAGSVNVPVLLGGPSGLASGSVVTVPYTTNDGSAKAGTDYTSTSGTLTFNPGQTAKNIPIPIIDRSGSAPARDFSVTLGTPTNATIADGTGVVTIGASGATAVSSPGVSAPPDLVVGEADGYVDLPVTLNAPGETSVTVNYSSAAGTAGAGGTPCSFNQLFQQQSGTLTFTPGVTTQDVRIVLDNCGISEANGFASFYLDLSGNSSNSTLTRSSTQVDITGDNATGATPALYVRDAVVDNGAGSVNVPVLLGGPSGLASGSVVTVPYTTNDGSAKAGTDYTSTSGTLTFNPGQTAKNIPIPIIDRSGSAPARDFSVTLGTPTNATIADGTGVVTIGASGATAVSSPGVSAPPDLVVGEADGYVDLPVTLNAPGETSVTVNYSSAAGTAGAGGTPCSFNQLFQQQSGTLTFTPGVTTQDVRIVLDNCSGVTTPAKFTVGLSSVIDGTIPRSTVTVTIDGTPTVPGTPTAVSAVAGNQSAVVSFTAPASDGGNAINGYTVTASPGGDTASGVSSPISVTGLTNGTSYTFTVVAINDVGTSSSSSASNAVTPVVILSTPTTPTISNLPASGAVGGGSRPP